MNTFLLQLCCWNICKQYLNISSLIKKFVHTNTDIELTTKDIHICEVICSKQDTHINARTKDFPLPSPQATIRSPSGDHWRSSIRPDRTLNSFFSTNSLWVPQIRTVPETSADAIHSPLGEYRATVAGYACSPYTCTSNGRSRYRIMTDRPLVYRIELDLGSPEIRMPRPRSVDGTHANVSVSCAIFGARLFFPYIWCGFSEFRFLDGLLCSVFLLGRGENWKVRSGNGMAISYVRFCDFLFIGFAIWYCLSVADVARLLGAT